MVNFSFSWYPLTQELDKAINWSNALKSSTLPIQIHFRILCVTCSYLHHTKYILKICPPPSNHCVDNSIVNTYLTTHIITWGASWWASRCPVCVANYFLIYGEVIRCSMSVLNLPNNIMKSTIHISDMTGLCRLVMNILGYLEYIAISTHYLHP